MYQYPTTLNDTLYVLLDKTPIVHFLLKNTFFSFKDYMFTESITYDFSTALLSKKISKATNSTSTQTNKTFNISLHINQIDAKIAFALKKKFYPFLFNLSKQRFEKYLSNLKQF